MITYMSVSIQESLGFGSIYQTERESCSHLPYYFLEQAREIFFSFELEEGRKYEAWFRQKGEVFT